MVITHNLQAMNSNRNYGIVCRAHASSSEKLASGYRINRAADDAAGLSISEKMRKQIRGLTRASENAQDGISLIQTAEGALNEVHDMLHRMNELAVKAANETNSDTDRQCIQDEIDQIKKEIDRVSVTTKFNEIYLLDGHLADPETKYKNEKEYDAYMQAKGWARYSDGSYTANNIFADAVKKISSIDEVKDVEGLKLIYYEVVDDVITQQNPTGSTGFNTPDANALKSELKQSIVPQAVNALLSAFPQTFGYLNSSSIGIGLELVDNPGSNTLASVTMGVSGYSDGTQIIPSHLSYKLTVNVASLKDGSGNISLAYGNNRNDLEVTIIHEMMHGMMDEALTNGMIGYAGGTSFDSSQQFSGWFKEGMAQVAAGGCYNGNDWVNNMGINGSTSPSVISSTVKNSANKLGTGSDRSKYGTGYLACMYLGYLAAGSPASVTSAGIANGVDKILDEIKAGGSLEDVIKKYTSYSSIAAFESGFGDADSSNFISKLANAAGTTGTGGVAAGFDNAGGILPDSSLPMSLFELDTDHTNVENTYPAGYEVLSGGSKTTSGASGTSQGGVGGSGGAGGSGGGGATPPGGGSRPVYADTTQYGILNLHVGSESPASNKIRVFIQGIGTRDIHVDEVDVTSASNATRSIDIIAFGIQKVSEQRSLLGAIQNRLEHTIKNLDNVVENTTASESQIRDTDMAKEMVGFANGNVLLQAGESMLAQSNQAKQGILTLLQ